MLIDKFKALSDSTRLRIIGLLSESNLCVCEIIDILGMTQSRISRHLGILKQAGLIEEERKGKWVIYKFSASGGDLTKCVLDDIRSDASYKDDLNKIKSTLAKGLCPLVTER